MASTYEKIAASTLSTSSASITFSSISGSYTDLVLICAPLSASADNVVIQYNGDTNTNYSWTTLGGNGTAASSNRGSNDSIPYCHYQSGTSTTQSNLIINIMNYSNTTTYKTAICRGNNASIGTDSTVVLWRSTSAITSILLKQRGSNNFASGSTFTLYGILKAA